MGPFPISNGYSYILLDVDYVSRWVEVVATKTNDAKVVVDFLKSNIFCRFGVPKDLISDQWSHFYNRAMSSLLNKRTGADSLRMRSRHTRQHTRLCCGCLPTGLSLVKPATYWLNWNIALTRQSSNAICPTTKLAKNGSSSYKNWRSSTWKHMRTPGSTSKKSSKLRYRWDGPFVITNVFPYGANELKDETTNNTFRVNEHQLKIFHEGPTPIASCLFALDVDKVAFIDCLEHLDSRMNAKLRTSQPLKSISTQEKLSHDNSCHKILTCRMPTHTRQRLTRFGLSRDKSNTVSAKRKLGHTRQSRTNSVSD
ncbi:hypothetical protein CR513_40756, partial [Mucuna pruriens]